MPVCGIGEVDFRCDAVEEITQLLNQDLIE